MTKSFSKINLLIKALMKNTTAEADPFKYKSLKIAITIIGSTIMLGCAIIVGYFTNIITTAVLVSGGNGTEGAQLIMYFISVFGAVFGVNVICGWLYFSIDMERILPYPFKPNEIFMSKFIVGYIQESIMEFLVIIGIIAGYMLAQEATISGIIFSIAGVILLPVLPLFYCALFAMIFMTFAKKMHSIKSVNMVSAICGIVFVLIFAISLFKLNDITVETFISSLADGSNIFMKLMQYIFFSIPILCNAINNQSILLFILFVAIHIAMLVILYMMSSKLYMYGVNAVMSAGKRQSHLSVKGGKSHSPFISCILRELKTLFRTPTYVVNCIMPNVLLPVAGILVVCTDSGAKINDYIKSFKAPDVLMIFASIIVACFITAMSGISSSSFTREGNHADLLKYLPIPYKTQIKVKMTIAIIFSLPSTIIGIALICMSAGCDLMLTLSCIVCAALAIFATICLGILFDAMHPKLVWEDELSALRGNMSTFLHMAVVIAFGLVVTILYLLFNSFISIPLLIMIMLSGTALIAVCSIKRTVKVLKEMVV